jgi:hypothetical protein
MFCNRNAAGVTASYVNGQCKYRPKPPGGFIYNNAYYRQAVFTWQPCPGGTTPYDTDLCSIGQAPVPGFVRNNSLYYTPPGKRVPYPKGSCVAPGKNPPAKVGNHTVSYEPEGCHVMLVPPGETGAVKGRYLGFQRKKENFSCAEGTFDTVNCLISAPPPGTTAYESGGQWYWTARYCP